MPVTKQKRFDDSFCKKVNGTYYVVEAVPESADKKLHIVSAYMDNNSGSITQALKDNR